MKKTILLTILITFCIALYSLSQAYAAANTLPLTPNNTKQPTQTTNNYNNPAPNVIAYGDPITDPRPKAIRYPIPL
jgi:hypothetical protein